MKKTLIPILVSLVILIPVLSGCGTAGANQPLTFYQLINEAEKYNGKTVTVEAFYFSGFEITALAGRLGPRPYNTSGLVPTGTLVWVNWKAATEVLDRLYPQTITPSGYPERFGKLKVTGQFETGKFGHLDAYNYRITITKAELLEWSRTPVTTTSNTDPTAVPVMETNPVDLVPVPTRAPISVVFPIQPEYFVPQSDIVVIGQVMEGLPELQVGSSVYRDWMFTVESYVVNPLSEACLKIRILERAGMMGVKGVHLKQGEYLLAFLKKEDDHYIFTDGLMGGKFLIEEGRVRFALEAYSSWQPLDEVISRVEAVALTWADEKLTAERQAEIENIALSDPGIKDFLTGKTYELSPAAPYLRGTLPEVIRYGLPIGIPQQDQPELQLFAVVNISLNKVDEVRVDILQSELSETERSASLQIALAEPVVQALIGGRGYRQPDIILDSWQETRDGRTVFNIFPKVQISLEPVTSNNLTVFVDLENHKVVKIFTESYLALSPTESKIAETDFELNLSIPKTEYRVGETAEAFLTLTYTGEKPVELTSPDKLYFDLVICNNQGDIIYQWWKTEGGYSAANSETVKEIITPGQVLTGILQFRVSQAGTLYIRGQNSGGWNNGEMINIGGLLVSYPNGSGYGVHLQTSYLVIQAE